MHSTRLRPLVAIALSQLILASSPARAVDASPSTPSRPTPQSVVAAYVASEQSATGLADFCARTRNLVVLAPDYPNCPPHDHLFIVDSGATHLNCAESGANAVRCTVQYTVVAMGGPELGVGELTTRKRHKLEEVFEVSPRTDGLISDPYKPPHIGLESALSAIRAEKAKAKTLNASAEYQEHLSRVERQLVAKGAKQ